MDFDDIIHVMKGYPTLYDSQHPTYKNHRVREEAWNDVAKCLGRGVQDVKQKWNVLRRRFQGNYKSFITPGKNFGLIKSEWIHFGEMEWLAPVIAHNLGVTSKSTHGNSVNKSDDCMTYIEYVPDPFLEEIRDPPARNSPMFVQRESNQKKSKRPNSPDISEDEEDHLETQEDDEVEAKPVESHQEHYKETSLNVDNSNNASNKTRSSSGNKSKSTHGNSLNESDEGVSYIEYRPEPFLEVIPPGRNDPVDCVVFVPRKINQKKSQRPNSPDIYEDEEGHLETQEDDEVEAEPVESHKEHYKETSLNVDNSNDVSYKPSSSSGNMPVSSLSQNLGKRKAEEVDIDSTQAKRNNTDDDDHNTQFLLSLLPTFRRLNARQTAIARMKINQVMYMVEFENDDSYFIIK